MTRSTRMLQLGIVVGAMVHAAAVVSAQDLRPSQNAYSNQGAAANRVPAPQIYACAGAGGPFFAVATDNRGASGGRGTPPTDGQAASRPRPGRIRRSASRRRPDRLDLETALRPDLAHNPNLVATRQNLAVSAAAVAVAQRFPTSLNPSVSVDMLPGP